MKNLCVTLLLIAGFVLLFAAAQRLVEPKYMTEAIDGALTAEYYQDAGSNEVLFVGDCEAYENFSPIELYRAYGVTSSIRGGAQQLIWHSYYLLEEALAYDSPKVAIFNVLAMKYGEPQSEPYNRLNLDGMRLSALKLEAVAASVTKGEDKLSYVLPLLRYHDRWSELSAADFRFFLQPREKVGHNGYLMRSDTVPVDVVPIGEKLTNYDLPERCWEYLEKIRILCQQKSVTLVLVKAPTIYPYWHEQWDEQIAEYADTHGLAYFNMLKLADEIGIDWETDTYDGGLHMNVQGAEKCARWIGARLKKLVHLADLRLDDKVDGIWQAKAVDYDRMKATQLEELATLGKIQTFTYRESGK
jgi:hypothetical protein